MRKRRESCRAGPSIFPATASIGGRTCGGYRNASSNPWFEARKLLFPVIVKVAATAGSWRMMPPQPDPAGRCICSGEEPSFPIMTPQTKLLSPTGRKALGTAAKSRTVPTMQPTQISAEIQRCRRNHHSDLPYTSSTRFSIAAHRPLHPILLDAVPAVLQEPRAHQRRKRQRNESRSENRDHDGNGELPENACRPGRT